MLNVIEYQGQRVLTTAQLATAFATTHNTIKNVFAHAKQQFQSGRDYFLLEGAPLRALKATPAAAAALPKSVSCLYLWTEQGAALLANLLAKPHAFDELKRVYFEAEPRHDADNTRQIVVIEGVHGYNGDDGFVYLDAEDVARGLGFVEEQSKFSPTSGGKTYTSIRWERINGYLADFGCPPIKKGDFIPESMFYLLAMKANNETAKKFQLKIANKILPSIRKYGYYVNEPVQGTLFPDEEPKLKKRRPVPKLAVVYVVEFDNGWSKLGFTSDLTERIARLVDVTKFDVTRYFSTSFMSIEDARQLESSLKARFYDSQVKGEFYSAPFDDIRAALTTTDPRVYELRELAKLMEPSPERNHLLLQAATLIKEKKLL